MGKQAFDQRAALANAFNTKGAAVVAPPKKEVQKEAPKPNPNGKGHGKRKNAEPEPPPKTKKDLEEEQRRHVEELELQRKMFYKAEETRKAQERKQADAAVTYVEDKNTRKPKAVSDISDYWKVELGLLPFIPSDNIWSVEDMPEELDPAARLEYLQMFNQQLEKLLRMKFNVFWSQVIFDPTIGKCIDAYLRFCYRSHDTLSSPEDIRSQGDDTIAQQERQVSKEVSRRVLQLLLRLSRPQESPSDLISQDKFAQVIHEHCIFDVPKIIDVCTIYGDTNRNAVTRIVHSVFTYQPLFKEEFDSVVEHMLDGLLQCCSPLQSGARAKEGELSVEECLTFLPDILSCFNAMFCFFPEDCVEKLMKGGLGADMDGNASLPMADLMVILHEGLSLLRSQSDDARLQLIDGITKMLCRLLCCVLGFRMAPRHGADAFGDLLEWLKERSERSTLLMDLSRNGLENVAMEWIASGLVDDAQLDYLDEICGAPLLPKEARQSRRRAGVAKQTPAAGAGAAPSSSSRPAASSSSSDAAKIKEVREVVGPDYGEGFLLQCLLHYGGSVPTVVGAILDGTLPPQLSALPIGLSIRDEIAAVSAEAEKPEQSKLSSADKQWIMGQAGRMGAVDRDEDEGPPVDEYDDDFDEAEGQGVPRLAAGGAASESEKESDEESRSSDEDTGRTWTNDRGRGGKSKGKGKGYAAARGPTQGQTVGARRKEENKARVANHNRRDGAMRKMARGM